MLIQELGSFSLTQESFCRVSDDPSSIQVCIPELNQTILKNYYTPAVCIFVDPYEDMHFLDYILLEFQDDMSDLFYDNCLFLRVDLSPAEQDLIKFQFSDM